MGPKLRQNGSNPTGPIVISINPKYDKLIIALRTAVEQFDVAAL
jgi:hypothetical protein